jgi:rhamnogalacturonan endolyase
MMRLLLALPLAASVLAADLFKDDFSKLPPGHLSQPVGQLGGAIQEYHYLAHRGVPTAPWENAIVHQDAWVVSDEDGMTYVEQHLLTTERTGAFPNDRPGLFQPLFITGDPAWHSYTYEVQMRPLSFKDITGVAFRYRTNRHFYVFGLRGGKEAVLRLRLPIDNAIHVGHWRELGAAPFTYDTQRYYTLKVENDGPKIRAYIDGKLILEASDDEIVAGRIGLTANVPARYRQVRVSAPDAVVASIQQTITQREAELERLQAGNPQPKLWKKFETPGYGAGRNVRFGDLDGDGQIDLLIAQNIPRVQRAAFDAISCLTAVTLDGKIIWQKGRPDPRNGLLTNDTPFQIHDIDGDGKNEVVMVRDFKLQILEGRTGELRLSVPTPVMESNLAERPYELNAGDSIAFANLSGGKVASEIILKDRYKYFWVYDKNLKQLWRGSGQTGHFPYPLDINGDGREEFALGYTLWRPDGKALWSHDTKYKDHADGIVIGNFTDNPKTPPRVYACGGDEGFLLWDIQGTLLKHTHIGHAQSPSIAKYRMDVPGLQLITINYWRNPGIVSLFDADGNLLGQSEPFHHGSPMLPVNWRGDGQEFSMLSAHVRDGGMIDGHFRRVVVFPDDGHPDLTYNVLNLTGDERDEIVVWDKQQVWIYTQDRPFKGSRIYAPVRNPDFNESNYRTTVSLPRWEVVK